MLPSGLRVHVRHVRVVCSMQVMSLVRFVCVQCRAKPGAVGVIRMQCEASCNPSRAMGRAGVGCFPLNYVCMYATMNDE